MTEPELLDPFTFGAEQQCYGCGPLHQHGLRMRFFKEGDEVVTRFVPGADLQGPPGICHGGIQTTLADELAGWTLIGLRGQMGFTASIDVRLIRPARVGLELVGRGRITSERGRISVVTTVFKQEDKTTLRGRITYVIPTKDEAEKVLAAPMPAGWERFSR